MRNKIFRILGFITGIILYEVSKYFLIGEYGLFMKIIYETYTTLYVVGI